MQITASKKSLILVLSLLLFIIVIIFLFFFLRGTSLSQDSINWDGVELVGSTESFCESLGCINNQDELVYSVPSLRILELSEDPSSQDEVVMSAEIWNVKNNRIGEVTIKMDKSLIRDSENLIKKSFPRNFSMEVLLEEYVFPKLAIDESRNLNFYRYKVSEIIFKDVQGPYSDENRDFSKLKEDILASLQQVEVHDKDVATGGSFIINKLYSYWGAVTKSRLSYSNDEFECVYRGDSTCGTLKTPTDYYEIVNLWEIGGIAEQKSKEELAYNCAVLKKYFPQEKCINPYPGLKEEIQWYLSVLDIPEGDDNQLPMQEDAVVGDPGYVLEARNDPDNWDYLSKTRTYTSRIATHIRVMVEYLYNSGLSCSDSDPEIREMCKDINSLYRYLEVDTTGLGFCSRRTFLPMFSIVSGDENAKRDLDYILENYPFEKECTIKGGAEGFCAVDLRERVACMEFLSESLEYYKESVEIEEILKQLTIETLDLYLEENSDKVGVWGRDEINAISGDPAAEGEIYPVQYYDYEDNYVIYNILDKYFNE